MATTADYIQNVTTKSVSVLSLKMAASVTLYKGTIVLIGADGYATTGADTASTFFGGVALEQKTNGVTEGATSIRVARDGRYEFEFSGATQAVVGDPVYIVDNNTVALVGTTTNDIRVGTVTRLVNTGKVEVELVIV